MKSLQEHKQEKENLEQAKQVEKMLGHGIKVLSAAQKNPMLPAIHIVTGALAIGATVVLHVPMFIIYALCALYVGSGIWILSTN